MTDPCVNSSDLYMLEDFTDPSFLSNAARREKLISIYRKTYNSNNPNEYKRNCFLKDQLLKSLTLEGIKQVTTWGNGQYSRRVKKIGLTPATDPDIFKTEYISERSIRFLNVFNNFEIVDCADYKVGSETIGVSSIHGSKETICKLSPIALIGSKEDKAELRRLREQTTFDNLSFVIPQYNKKYTNINGQIWKRLVAIVEKYSASRRNDIPTGVYYGELNNSNKADGYGELVYGDAIVGNNADETESNRGEVIGYWKEGIPRVFYRVDRVSNEYNLKFEVVNVDTKTELIIDCKVNFNKSIKDEDIIHDDKVDVYELEIRIIDVVEGDFSAHTYRFPVFRHSIYEGSSTVYLQEYYTKLAIFICLINLVDKIQKFNNKYMHIYYLLSLDNFNFDDILQVASIMLTQFDADNIKLQFKEQFVKDIIAKFINIQDNDYIKRINTLKPQGTLIEIELEPAAIDFEEDELPPIAPMLRRSQAILGIPISEQDFPALPLADLDEDASTPIAQTFEP